VNARGGPVRLIPRGADPRWSPDGRLLAYVGQPPELAVVVWRYGLPRQRTIGTGGAPVWSRHGTWIAWMNRTEDVVATRPDGSGARTVTHESQRLSRPPEWLGDGRLVYGLFPS
jgi:Tol biopolymer transport system component